MKTYKLLLIALAVAVTAFVVVVLLDLRAAPESPDDPLTAGVGAGEGTRLAPEDRIGDRAPAPRRRSYDAANPAIPAADGGGAPVARTDLGGGDPHDWRPEGVPGEVKWDRVMRRSRSQLVPEVRRCFQDAGELDDNANYEVSYRLVVASGRARLDQIAVAGADDDPVADCIIDRLGRLDYGVDAVDFDSPVVDSFVVYEVLGD